MLLRYLGRYSVHGLVRTSAELQGLTPFMYNVPVTTCSTKTPINLFLVLINSCHFESSVNPSSSLVYILSARLSL